MWPDKHFLLHVKSANIGSHWCTSVSFWQGLKRIKEAKMVWPDLASFSGIHGAWNRPKSGHTQERLRTKKTKKLNEHRKKFWTVEQAHTSKMKTPCIIWTKRKKKKVSIGWASDLVLGDQKRVTEREGGRFRCILHQPYEDDEWRIFQAKSHFANDRILFLAIMIFSVNFFLLCCHFLCNQFDPTFIFYVAVIWSDSSDWVSYRSRRGTWTNGSLLPYLGQYIERILIIYVYHHS